MDVVTGVSLFSHVLNIKDKIFPKNTESISTIDSGEEYSNYCSIYIEHNYSESFPETDRLELMLTKKSNFTIPIRRLDWVMLDSKLDYVQLREAEIPIMFLVTENGALFEIEFTEIMRSQIEFLGLKARPLKKALNSLVLQCTYADGFKQRVSAPESLKNKIFEHSNVNEYT